MKKLVVAAVATFVVGSIFADGETLRFRTAVSNITSTSEAVLEVKSIMETALTRILPPRVVQNLNAADKATVDGVFGPIDGHYVNSSLPICFTNYINSRFVPNESQTYNAVALRSGVSAYTNMKPENDEVIVMFGELTKANWRTLEAFRYWQNWMKKFYFQELKLWFRKNGKSVVEKNGVNPLAPYMDGLMAALNAPRMEGLNQCLETIGIDKRVDLSALPSADEINKMRDEVLIANIDLTKNKKAAVDLMICLGVDGYNEMVRQYNGEE